MKHRFAIAAALLLAGLVSGPSRISAQSAGPASCAPSMGLNFVCGMKRPEDLLQVGNSKYLVFGGSAPSGGISIWWEYAPGGYAILGSVFGRAGQPLVPSREELLQLAEAVHFVDPYPMPTPDLVPFRLAYLPDGITRRPTEMHFQENRPGEISLWLSWSWPDDPDAFGAYVAYQPVHDGNPPMPITLGGRPGDESRIR